MPALSTTNGSQCRFCNSPLVSTIDSRPAERPGWRRRRKKCLTCEQRWSSIELPVEDIQTILHITTNLDTLSTLAHKLHTEIEAMRQLSSEQDVKPAEEIKEMELTDL